MLWAILLGAEPATAETIAPVFQQALPNAAGKIMPVATVDFAPASRAVPAPARPGVLFAYVLQGTIRSQLDDQPPQTYVAGPELVRPPAPIMC